MAVYQTIWNFCYLYLNKKVRKVKDILKALISMSCINGLNEWFEYK